MRRSKGIASIVEAMIISIAIATLVAIAFGFFSSYMNSMHPKIRYINFQADLCGKVLTVKNIGDYPVEIDKIVAVYVDNYGYAYANEINVYTTLQPGESKEFILPQPYQYVSFITKDFRSPPIDNDCTWITVGAGEGGMYPTHPGLQP
jgi:hypothetical protein